MEARDRSDESCRETFMGGLMSTIALEKVVGAGCSIATAH